MIGVGSFSIEVKSTLATNLAGAFALLLQDGVCVCVRRSVAMVDDRCFLKFWNNVRNFISHAIPNFQKRQSLTVATLPSGHIFILKVRRASVAYAECP